MAVDTRTVQKSLAETGRFGATSYFVGRKDELDRFAFDSTSGARLVWLHGLHRIGKSCLAAKLLEDSARTGVKTAWLDLTEVRERHFDELLDRIQRALEEIEVPIGSQPRSGLESLATRRGGPIVRLVLDEFDHVAIHLTGDQQAFLRKVLESGQNLGLVVITRINPSHIVEQIPDVRSYLLQNAQVRRVSPLKRAEVSKLFLRLAEDLEMPELEVAATRVFDLVGGHPLSVRRLAAALVSLRDEGLDTNTMEEALHDAKSDVEPRMRSLWEDLQPKTRQFLLQGLPRGEHDDDGFTTGTPPNLTLVRPQWLVEAGERLGVVTGRAPGGASASDVALVKRTFELIYEINRRSETRPPNQKWFTQTTDTLQWYELLRVIEDELGFRNALTYLYKTLFEGPRSKEKKAWKIPEPSCGVYAHHPAVGALSDLRNFFEHQQDRDRADDAKQKDAADAGKRFEYLIQKNYPSTTDDWARAHRALLEKLVDALEVLLESIA